MTVAVKKFHGNRTHGDTVDYPWTPEYRSWASAKQRCEDKTKADYGGRGITMCDRWRLSYEDFLADMGRKPTIDHSLDRIDVNGNYEPSNCRWATRVEQNNNMRHNVVLEHNGESLNLKQWATKLGMNYNMIVQRRHRGWPEELLLSPPGTRRVRGV